MDAYVLLLLLVWAFSAVCEDSLSITCDDVTGHVGKELTLTCRVSYLRDTCYITYYKFMNKNKGTTICREEFTDPCQQLIIISCPYTANEVMTSSFKFFIQTTSGQKSADFTVTITDFLKITCDDVTGHVGKELTLTCRVSYQSDTCNIKNYRFINKDKGTTICREDFTSASCKQWTIFSCPYTANEAMTSSFKFFMQTTHGASSADLTVTITDTVFRDSLTITCDDVTDRVGKELTLTCRVSYPSDTCCIMMYKFMNKDKATTICREEVRINPCMQSGIFLCPYTANEVMTSTFKFFMQTTYGATSADFTVTIADAVKEDDTGGPETAEESSVPTGTTVLAVIISIISCSIIIVITVFILKKKCNSAGIESDYNLVERTTDVTAATSTTTVNVRIENPYKNNITVSVSTTN